MDVYFYPPIYKYMRTRILTSALIVLSVFGLLAQPDNSSARILHGIQKLQNTTRVLYLAAHPDDENTRMISWLENDRHIRTAYLSLTRGDGGQNLIGTELGAKLGVLRTQELMQARAIDGGEQFFTRAVDFGYSKTADETFTQWKKDQVLADVVWVIRTYQPDIIITRFPPDGRGGHGHHTASAMLAVEAFELAAEDKSYSEQLQYVDTWQVKRLFWNHSTWWRQNLDSIAAADDDYSVMDIGTYNSVLGMSCNELGSYSRTQHKSQGFGVSVRRGSTKEYLQLLKGDKVKEDITDDIVKGWERYDWSKGDQMLAKLIDNFDALQPHLSVDLMLEILASSEVINNEAQRNWFQEEFSELIASAMGLHVEVNSLAEYVSLRSTPSLTISAINRSPIEVAVTEVRVEGEQIFKGILGLDYNEISEMKFDLTMGETHTQAYWLRNEYDKMFVVEDQELIGMPENGPAPEVKISFEVNGKMLELNSEVIYKFTDRVDGEIERPMIVAPIVVADPAESNLIFVGDQSQTLDIEMVNVVDQSMTVRVNAEGWSVEPQEVLLESGQGQEKQAFQFTITPTDEAEPAEFLELELEDQRYSPYSMTEIDYPHIDKRVVFEETRVKLVKLDLDKKGEKIGYIVGAGDMVPEALKQMGYEVDILSKEMILSQDLSQYQAIMAGIRAYNTEEWLPEVFDNLMAYVKGGGNYIVQYNTASRDLRSTNFGPYNFTLSRERVTEEDAEVQFLLPDHPLLNQPNKISEADFDNWVQERGLYFAGSWDIEKYEAPLGWHDEGEPSRNGGLLFAKHGEGAFIYTGISFFRELPAGVPGAYRLLANLVSYNQD